jgi:hypothetical protein
MSGYDSDDSISEPASTHNTTNSSLASPISNNTPNHHNNHNGNNNNNNNNNNTNSNNHMGVSSSGLLTPSSVSSSQTSLSQFSHGLSSPPMTVQMQNHNRFDYGRPMTDTTGLGGLGQVHSTSSSGSFDFKPQHLADWYSHAHMGMMGVPRYEPMKPVSHALPTPPSSGHSPISHLSNHLHQLLPSTTTAYT